MALLAYHLRAKYRTWHLESCGYAERRTEAGCKEGRRELKGTASGVKYSGEEWIVKHDCGLMKEGEEKVITVWGRERWRYADKEIFR